MKEKPFIHLLKSPYHCYIFDINTNSIVRVSDELYSYLQAEQKGIAPPLLSAQANEERGRLEENGYLKTKHPIKMENPQWKNIDYLINHHMGQLILQVTQQCNFRCSYCAYTTGDDSVQRGHSNKRMSWKTAKAAIDFWAERIRHSAHPSVSFYGGEPLLEWPLIQKCIEYAKEKAEGKKISFNMTTNATLLTTEMARFFVREHVSLMISLDGPKEIHDRNRRFASNGEGTFDTVVSVLETMKREVPGFQQLLSYNSVVDPCTSTNCISSFFAQIESDQKMPSLLSPPPGTRLWFSDDYSMENREAGLMALLHHQEIIPLEKLDMFSISQVEAIDKQAKLMIPIQELPDCTGHAGPCIPGVRRLFVSVDGTFFPCERCSETSDNMNIGNLSDGFDMEQIGRLMNISSVTEDKCKNCWALSLCSACAVVVDSEKERFSEDAVYAKCGSIRSEAEWKLKNLIALSETKDMGKTFVEGERV